MSRRRLQKTNHRSENGSSSNTELTTAASPSIDFLRSVAPGAKCTCPTDSRLSIPAQRPGSGRPGAAGQNPVSPRSQVGRFAQRYRTAVQCLVHRGSVPGSRPLWEPGPPEWTPEFLPPVIQLVTFDLLVVAVLFPAHSTAFKRPDMLAPVLRDFLVGFHSIPPRHSGGDYRGASAPMEGGDHWTLTPLRSRSFPLCRLLHPAETGAGQKGHTKLSDAPRPAIPEAGASPIASDPGSYSSYQDRGSSP